jgi:SAM-dependent methyltransferase
VDTIDPHYRHRLEELGATVTLVPRVSRQHGYSNKLRLLEQPALRSFDTIVLLDCDTVIVQDPRPWLDGQKFQAKIADAATVPPDVLRRVFEHLGVALPALEHHCNPSSEPTIWYCNAGVLVFPRSMLDTLAAGWQAWNQRLLERLDLLRPHQTYCDQASLSLAFAEHPVPFAELPLAMNFPLHLSASAYPALGEPCDPVIIYYHDRVTPHGYLQPGPNALVQARIDAFNARVHAARRRRFDNRLFWDFRYSHAPDLGSGVGSRGETAEYKRALLQRVMESERPDSVLDVGCGDQHVSQVLPDAGYVGLDISRVVVERNRQAYAGRRFECGDLLDPNFNPVPCEGVVCLDVLIHIDRIEAYRAFVHRLVTLARRFGIVSGYEAAPPARSQPTEQHRWPRLAALARRLGVPSRMDSPPAAKYDMIFYHEPLSRTLREAGVADLQPIGTYHGLTMWRFTPGAVAAAPRVA